MTKKITIKKKFQKFRTKCIELIQNITLEPLLLTYLIPGVLCSFILTSMVLEKACKANSGFNDTICASIANGENNFPNEKLVVQSVITNVQSWNLPTQKIVSLIFILFIGSFSDRYKIRKPFLLLPLVGDLVLIVGYLLCAKFMREWPLEYLAILQTVTISIFGGEAMHVTLTYAYMTDISKEESRTFRFGVTQIMINMCAPLTHSFSGPLFKAIGYYGSLSLCGVIYFLGLMYGIFILKESGTPIPRDKSKWLLADFFDPSHIGDTFKLLTRKTEENNREFIVVLMVIGFFFTGAVAGEMTLFFLYFQTIFNWTVSEFFYFVSAVTVVHFSGALISVPLFTKILKLSDFTIMIICFVDKIISNLIIVSSVSVITLYICAVVGSISGILPITIRSLTSKVVSKNDWGKAQTLFSISDAIGVAIAVPIYNQSYKLMVAKFPGGFLLFAIGIVGICICLTLWMAFKSKNIKITPDNQNEGGNSNKY